MSTDSALLQADLEARREALDVTQSCIVQAPAGSGKTELLIQRYLCLLATVAEPEEVIAITFTRKAASEMQLRVIEALERAARGETGAAEHQQRTLQAAAAILERDSARDWRLLESPRRMRILTLDAWCASITRLLPASSGLGGSLTTAADQAIRQLYREAATATLDWLPGTEPAAAAITRVLQHLDNDVGAYIGYLARMLAKREQWLEIVGSGASDHPGRVREALEANIAQQLQARLRLLHERLDSVGGVEQRRLLRYAGRQLEAKDGKPHPLCNIRESAWPEPLPEEAATWRAIAALLLKADGTLRNSVNVNNGFPPRDDGQKAAFTEWLRVLQDRPALREHLNSVRDLPDPRYRDEQWQVLLALFALLPLAVAELRRLFAERGLTDHVEVAQAASAALGSPEQPGELAMLLDYRVQHLLVDEMQDTATGQYRLLAQLTAGWEQGDGRTLFCVGDPMQSIYRFRDAAVGQFVAARTHGIGEQRLQSLVLRQNFRSGVRLVAWFNAAFARILPAADEAATGAIAYSPSVPVAARSDSGSIAVHALIDATPAEEATRSAAIIDECLQNDEAGRVAVLVRSRTQLPHLLSELRRRDIACQAIEIDRLTDVPEIIDLLALTRALCHQSDRTAWLALLRGPWCGLGWADIHALVYNDRESTIPELAQDSRRLEAQSPEGRERLTELLARLSEHPARPHGARSLRERVERTWLALGGAACLRTREQLDNAYRYLDVLEKLEFAGTLADVAMLERQLDDERVSSPGNEQTRVQVMTMHKAKGLEFEHVVLHGLGRTTGGGDRDVLEWLTVTADDGTSSMMISPLGPRAEIDKDPLHRFIGQAARESDRLELDRLLYVACTRAMQSLHLVGTVGTRRRGAKLGRPPGDSLLARLWPVVEADFESAFAAYAASGGRAATDDDKLLASPVALRMPRAWRGPPLPAPPPAVQAARAPVERAVDYDWVGSAARHAGTLVHRWLQKMADSSRANAQLPADLADVSRRWAQDLGVTPNDLDRVIRRVATALEAVCTDPAGRWLLDGEGAAELRVSGMLDGVRENAVIDRVRIDDGIHWLVDYKTGTHEGGDLPGFLAQEADRYRPQLKRYRNLYVALTGAEVRTALYFPLLQEFVEVDARPASVTDTGQAGS